MKILCITHADFETPGVIEAWASEFHHEFYVCKPYQGEDCFKETFDFLIIMGGPQSPLALDKAPYLRQEINLIHQAIKNENLVLGFCLGAQLIGEALGGKTERSPYKEIGVFPITLTEAGLSDPLLQGLSPTFSAIHWHNDMPGITADSKILAFSEGCPRQIIKYGEKIYGFQCHLEITQEGMKEMIQACPHDLAPKVFVQSEAELLSQNYNKINELMKNILNKLTLE